MKRSIVTVQRDLFAEEQMLPSASALGNGEEIIELLSQLLWQVVSEGPDPCVAKEEEREQD